MLNRQQCIRPIRIHPVTKETTCNIVPDCIAKWARKKTDDSSFDQVPHISYNVVETPGLLILSPIESIFLTANQVMNPNLGIP